MRRKLLWLMIAVVLIVTVFCGVFINIAVHRIQQETALRRLRGALALIVELGTPTVETIHGVTHLQLDSLFDGKEGTDDIYRLTLITLEGDVLADSQADSSLMENHLGRPEVQKALQDGWGHEIRTSSTTKVPFLYVAQLLKDGKHILRIAQPLSELHSSEQAVIEWSAIGACVGIAMAFFFGLLLLRHFLAPLTRLQEATQRIAAGDYHVRVPKESDEIGHLADAFNAMADALEQTLEDERTGRARLDSILESTPLSIIAVNARGNIIAINPTAAALFNMEVAESMGKPISSAIRHAGLNRTVEETLREGKPQDVEYAGDRTLHIVTALIRLDRRRSLYGGAVIIVEDVTKVRQLERIRTEFASNVTHELKTPLTSIQGYIETLGTGVGEDPRLRAEILEILEIQSDRLRMMIDDLLALAEIESGSDIERVPCDLNEQVEAAIQTLEPSALQRDVQLKGDLAKHIVVAAHPGRILRLVTNLVDNAIKYNRPGGSVIVKTLKLPDRARLIVADTGIGIPSEHHNRVFERFYRVDRGRSRELGGTGLGLSIVKHLVQLYGGDIHFESIPGKGSTFYIDLPLM